MSKFELVAFDMDGTLLNSKKVIPLETLAAIKKAKNCGKIVCLSTGRSLAELKLFGDLLDDVDFFIMASGAAVFDNRCKKMIFSQPIDGEIVERLFDVVSDKDVMIHIHSDESIVEKAKLPHIADYNMGVYKASFEKITVQPENLRDYYIEEKFAVYKLNYYLRSVEEREPLRQKIMSAGICVDLVNSEITSLECTALGVSKGSGLKVLCEFLNLPVEKTIAVGDSDNDLAILKVAGCAVAMGNANKNVMAVADVVVRDNDNGGCVQVIEEILLGA